jgi:hydroxyacylglutathione hydrolase
MLFERFEVAGLAHHSYAVGCEASGQLAIVDPERIINPYLELAQRRGFRISHVLETHIHADYASGARELAATTGAELCLSRYDCGERFEIAFPHRRLSDGERIQLGKVSLVARHCPGHTPEHLAFVVFDGARSATVPMLMLSGDFLFVGSVGRPDLLGEEATRGLAARLYGSLQALADLPDGLEIHPGHGAGSMCGAGMSGRPASTLGFERAVNPYLDRRLSAPDFITRLLESVPPFPPYYTRMKELNSRGPAPLRGRPPLLALDPPAFQAQLAAGALAIDLREAEAFGSGHLPGAFGIGAGSSLATWAAWVVPYDTPLLLVAGAPEIAENAARSLARVGFDEVVGTLAGGMGAWQHAGLPLRRTPQLGAPELAARLRSGELAVLDVRSEAEWRAGHIPGAVNLMAGWLASRTDEVPGGGPLALVCATGYRSTVAASVLERAGCAEVFNLAGGMGAWQRAGLPMTAAASD